MCGGVVFWQQLKFTNQYRAAQAGSVMAELHKSTQSFNAANAHTACTPLASNESRPHRQLAEKTPHDISRAFKRSARVKNPEQLPAANCFSIRTISLAKRRKTEQPALLSASFPAHTLLSVRREVMNLRLTSPQRESSLSSGIKTELWPVTITFCHHILLKICDLGFGGAFFHVGFPVRSRTYDALIPDGGT